jgi:CBS domain-containing protein
MELRSILTSTKVSEVALANPPSFAPSDTIAAAVDGMRAHSHGSAVICSGRKLLGIFTERDLLRFIAGGGDFKTPLSQVMTASPKTLTADSTLFDAAQSMDQGGYRRMPVIDDEGSPVGIIDVKTITHFLVEHFPSAVYNQASHAQLLAKHPEGA